MQSKCASSRSSERQLNNDSGRNYLSKVTKFLGFRTVSTTFSFENHLTNLVPPPQLSCLDGGESVTSESDIPLLLDCSHNRVLKHALSAPDIRPYSPSVASTRCLSLTSEDSESSPLTLCLRTQSLSTALDERAGPVIDIKPNTKRCWFWDLVKGNKHPRSFPTFLCTSPVPSLNTPSPSKITFVPHPPLSEIFPANLHNLQLAPVDSNRSGRLDDMSVPQTPKSARRKSLHKLSRTLGVPLHDFEPRNASRPDTRSRKMSISHNITSTEEPSDVLPSSRKSLSPLNTGDLHFNLANDLSDNWTKIRPDSRASAYSPHSPISPIMFSPPTPVTSQLPRPLPSAENMKLQGGSFSSSSRPHVHTTLNRSRSMTFAPLRSKFDRLVASADTIQSTTGSPPSVIKVNEPESTREEVSKARNFVVAHPEYIEDFTTWSRQWNQDSGH